MTDLQEELCQRAENNYEDKIETIMDLEILRIEDDYVIVKDVKHGEVGILLSELI
jgi:hypothetical protein